MIPSACCGSGARASTPLRLTNGTQSNASSVFAPGSLNQSPLSVPNQVRPRPSRTSVVAGCGGSGMSIRESLRAAGAYALRPASVASSNASSDQGIASWMPSVFPFSLTVTPVSSGVFLFVPWSSRSQPFALSLQGASRGARSKKTVPSDVFSIPVTYVAPNWPGTASRGQLVPVQVHVSVADGSEQIRLSLATGWVNPQTDG